MIRVLEKIPEKFALKNFEKKFVQRHCREMILFHGEKIKNFKNFDLENGSYLNVIS